MASFTASGAKSDFRLANAAPQLPVSHPWVYDYYGSVPHQALTRCEELDAHHNTGFDLDNDICCEVELVVR